MEFFSHQTKIDFMAQRRWAFLFSFMILVFSLGSLLIKGLNLGLDFTGGVQLEFSFPEAPDHHQLRERLAAHGLEDATVQAYGDIRQVVIKLKLRKEVDQRQLVQQVVEVFEEAKLERVDMIGAQMGHSLVLNGFLAIVVALLGTMVYIAFRFERRFAVSAVISLIHDPILILGVFSWFQIEFDLIGLAAILTVLGYSLNDTIVVYDRVRENFRRYRELSSEAVLNLSVNQTLSRTIMISSLTFLVVTVLFIFGGQGLRAFSLAMMLGIVVGTYSSIYIAGAVSLLLGLDRKHLVGN